MAELVWGDIGQRYFESGIDRGVLYPPTGSGVAWNGITGISESPSGGTPKPFYADGFKYLNLSSAEEYGANLTAISAPDEFAKFDGTRSVLNGLFITQQKRESFGLSYRTMVGNGTDGTEHGYKIHLIYNALASATSRNYQTISATPNPLSMSWQITTVPPEITGYRPSAHFIVDSRYTPKNIMITIESWLYGTLFEDPFLPSVSQIVELFSSYIPAPDISYLVIKNTTSGLSPISVTELEDGPIVRATSIDGIYQVLPNSSLIPIDEGFFI